MNSSPICSIHFETDYFVNIYIYKLSIYCIVYLYIYMHVMSACFYLYILYISIYMYIHVYMYIHDMHVKAHVIP